VLTALDPLQAESYGSHITYSGASTNSQKVAQKFLKPVLEI